MARREKTTGQKLVDLATGSVLIGVALGGIGFAWVNTWWVALLVAFLFVLLAGVIGRQTADAMIAEIQKGIAAGIVEGVAAENAKLDKTKLN